MKQLTPAFIYPLTGMAAIVSLTSCASEKESSKPYNIVYIMTDDHTAQIPIWTALPMTVSSSPTALWPIR